MAASESKRSAHRVWIGEARRQVDDAEQRAVSSHGVAAAVRTPLLSADAFPGFELRHEIHRGAQGSVHLALQKSTGREVALKLLHQHAFGGPLERARFEREARILAALRHPNIVTIYDGGSIDGRVYLVMDYIAGEALDAYMAGRKLSVHETLALFIPICDAVDAAHMRGVIHRDLKPANVRVDATGRPVVLDFGLAKFAGGTDAFEPDGGGQTGGAITQTGQFLGTLPWAAPEQADGSSDDVDTRTDVYALGVLLYQMLTGQFPYEVVGSMRAVLDNIASAQPTPPRKLCRAIDDELETILLKCLSKERERRYQTAGDLVRDLRRYLAGEPVEAKRDSAMYVLRKTIRRYGMPLSVLGGTMLLLIGLSITAWNQALRANQAADTARKSDERAVGSLRDSLIAQARALRSTGKIGQRFQALDALAKAAAIAPGLDARNEAIASMILPDLRPIQLLRRPGTAYFDANLARCALLQSDHTVTVTSVSDDAVIAEIPAPACGVKEIHWGMLCGRFFARVFDPPEGSRRLEVWTIPEARLQLEIPDVPDRARFDVSPDGSRLAVGRLDQAIHIYELETGRETERVPVGMDPAYVSFDPSGRRLAMYHAGFQQARILDLDSGKSEPAFTSNKVAWSVAWRPDGKLLAGATGSRVELWDPGSRRTVGVLAGHEAQVVHIRFSHDGEMILTSSWDGESVLWDSRTRRALLNSPLLLPVFSPDDQWVAGTMGIDGELRGQIFELATGAYERRRLVGSSDVDVLAGGLGDFGRSGKLLFLGCASAVPGARGLRVIDCDTGREVLREIGDDVRGLVVDARDRFLLEGAKDSVNRRTLRIENGSVSLGLPEPVLAVGGASLFLSADSELALATGYSAHEFALIDLRDGDRTRHFPLAEKGMASLSPDGNWAAFGGWRGSSGQVWDLQRGVPVLDLPTAQGVSFSPDGRRLVVSGFEGLTLLEVSSWRLVRQAAAPVGAIVHSPDGRMLAVQVPTKLVQLRNPETLEVLATLEPPESYATWQCCFSMDSARLAQVTSRAGVVHVWDLRSICDRLASMGLDWGRPKSLPPRLRAVDLSH